MYKYTERRNDRVARRVSKPLIFWLVSAIAQLLFYVSSIFESGKWDCDMSETAAAFLILILFLSVAVSIALFFACLKLWYEKANLKKSPRELIKRLALKEPVENILFIYPQSGWIAGKLVVKNHSGEEVGVIKLGDPSRVEILVGGEIYIAENLVGMMYSRGAILYNSNENSERKVLATQTCEETILGSSSFKLSNDREIKFEGRGISLLQLNKVHDISENGRIVGSLFSRQGVGILCLPSDISLAERLFVVLREIMRSPP